MASKQKRGKIKRKYVDDLNKSQNLPTSQINVHTTNRWFHLWF